MHGTNNPKPDKLNLEKNELWLLVNEIVGHMYNKLPDFPTIERWGTENKVRSASVDLLFAVSQAIGNAAPSALEYDWAYARKYAASLKTIYRFAGRQKQIEIEPSIMLKLDKLIDLIDTYIEQAYEQSEQNRRQELALWQEKYRLGKGKK